MQGLLNLELYRADLGDEKTKEIASAFMEVFNSREGRLVLDTLQSFCRYNDTILEESDRLTFAMEGRRHAFLFIEEWRNLDWRVFETTDEDDYE